MQLPVAEPLTIRQVGVYEVGEEIGRGNVAVVYRARDTLYDREVALKVLHPYFAHYLTFVRHFVAEGRAGMRLHHPNIVQVFDAGQSDGVAYIAQELITGGTLADMIQARGGPFSLDETLAVLEQAAAGLDYAHHLGCLHRNLKPSNLFFADQGRIQVADFGAALGAGSTPPANYPVGTPTFMAPEQARGDVTLDPRADVYALGAIGFLMLTGRPPFEAENPLVLLRKIIEETPPLLERLQPDISPAVAQVMSQVLAKRPSARYLTATAFAQALAHGQPVSIRQEPPPTVIEPPAWAAPTPAPASPPPVLAAKASPAKGAGASKISVSRRAVMVGGMLLVTLLLLLLIVAVRVAPGFFQRVTGQETPAAQIAVITAQTRTPNPMPTTRMGNTPTAVALLATTTAPLSTTVPTKAATVIATAATPPPTVRIVPAALATTASPAPATPTTPPLPTATPTASATATATTLPTLAGDTVLVANLLEVAVATTLTPTLASPAPPVAAAAPSGRIAYTYKNPKTDELDTALYNLATGTSWPIFAAKRQPDFNNQGDLVLNSEGGGVDALVLMRAPGELLGVASAFSEDGHPHWSPTNKSIVFDSALVGDGRHRLYLQRDDNYGQKVGPLMYDAWEIFGRYPIFLLDGRIAYNGCNVWENASTCGIYVVDTWGNQPQNLTNWPRDIPTDNLGSQILMMSDRAGDWNVYLVDPAGGAPRQLTDDPAADGLATASPDGNWIAFVSDRDGPWAVYAMQSDGSNLQKLFELEYGYGPGETWLQERLSWGW